MISPSQVSNRKPQALYKSMLTLRTSNFRRQSCPRDPALASPLPLATAGGGAARRRRRR
jgi:hypothetical protein